MQIIITRQEAQEILDKIEKNRNNQLEKLQPRVELRKKRLMAAHAKRIEKLNIEVAKWSESRVSKLETRYRKFIKNNGFLYHADDWTDDFDYLRVKVALDSARSFQTEIPKKLSVEFYKHKSHENLELSLSLMVGDTLVMDDSEIGSLKTAMNEEFGITDTDAQIQYLNGKNRLLKKKTQDLILFDEKHKDTRDKVESIESVVEPAQEPAKTEEQQECTLLLGMTFVLILVAVAYFLAFK